MSEETIPAAPVETPVETVESTQVAEPVVETPAEEPSLLGEEPKQDSETKVEPVVEEPKEESESEEAPLPSYEPFSLPEGINLDGEQLEQFTKDLSEFETLTKADHAEVQKFGQKLVDKYISEMQSVVARVQEAEKVRQSNERLAWKDEFINHPDIGGNRQDTTLKSAKELINTHGGKFAQPFIEIMNQSGLGNHPSVIGFLANVGRNYTEGTSLPAVKPDSGPRSKIATRYGSTG